MSHKIFYSWQTDVPPKEGRNFIESALEKALKLVAADTELEEAVRDEGLELDKDTKGVSGMPPIMETIFDKIDQAAAFVADFTFIGKRFDDKRLMPNPNVLIEYGWAMKSLGFRRIVGVMNTAHGDPNVEPLPFDLGHLRRPICYCVPENADETTRKTEHEKLVQVLKKAIQAILESEDFLQTLPAPPEPIPFPAKQPEEGQARFRNSQSHLGLSDSTHIFGGRANEKIWLASGPALWLRVMPTSALDHEFSQQQLKTAMGTDLLMPMGRINPLDAVHLRASDGYGRFIAPAENRSLAGIVSFAFKTGEVWGINPSCLGDDINNYGENAHSGIPQGIELHLRKALVDYATFLSRLGIGPPYRWIAGLEGIEGKRLCVPAFPNNFAAFNPMGHCVSEMIVDEGTYQPSVSVIKTLSPLFHALYEACNVPRPAWLDED